MRTENFFLQKYAKNKNRKLISLWLNFSLKLGFSNFFSSTVLRRYRMRKFSLRILTSLCVFEEHREISEAYMENTANLELFAVHKIFSEYAERIYAYIEKTSRDTKLCTDISQLIIIQILNFFGFFLSSLYGMD